ncbi:MAG: PolC-type DNA polymerase III [bacterium]|nr:PolC-type DNA polymerase III [bacterium]
MNDKLKILFKQVGFTKIEEFKGACLEKIVVYDDNKMWEFLISVDNALNIDTYLELIAGIKKKYNNISNIDLTIKLNNIDYTMMRMYWTYILDELIKKNTMMEVFRDRDIEIKDNTLLFKAYNKAEFMSLKKVQTYIKTYYHKLGFVGSEIDIVIDDNGDSEIYQKIEQEKKDVSITVSKPAGLALVKDDAFKKYKSKRNDQITKICDINFEVENITIEGRVFGIDIFESKSGFKITTIKITDESDSIYVKTFTKDVNDQKILKDNLKVGKWYRFYGRVVNDTYASELVFNTRIKDIEPVEKEEIVRVDKAKEKRVELHAHTMMSQMDGVVSAKNLIKRAISFGHKAIAITDHNCCQAFPEAYKFRKDIKVIFGCELNLIDDDVDICFRETEDNLLDSTYVIFDFETTGFNAGGTDSIIEVGAVKINHGEIIDRFSELINPKRLLPAKIVEITHITDAMLENCDIEENVIRRFIEWVGDLPMVAHNAKFDCSFLEMAYRKYQLGSFNNTVIDTLELSRAMNPSASRHSLSALVKKYDVSFDESSHHRADYDAEATGYVFHKMLKELNNRNIESISDLNKLIDKNQLHTLGFPYRFTMLAKTQEGLQNLYKIVSYANTKYYYKNPRILRSKLVELRNGILIGSSCANGEVFTLARSKSDEELANIIKFYDYIEIQPIDVYDYLIQSGDFASYEELVLNIQKIIRIADEVGVIVVASGDVHQLDKEDTIYREIIVNQKVPGGGFHPLNKKSIKKIPSQYFRTTDEMLEAFNFLNKDKAYELVVTNPLALVDKIEDVVVIIDTKGIPFSPKMKDSDKIVKEMVYNKAHEMYGDPLPDLIEQRIKRELDGIIGGGFDVIYLIAQKLVKKSNDDGYFVGSRGSVGSSFVATMMGISEVNPLPAHYVCKKCKTTIFEENGVMLSKEYSSGYDLPDKLCACGEKLFKEGQDMPFETFLGFKADKVPDIDLNFSSEYQSVAHEYTKVLFGEEYVYRAGTVGTVAEKTAFGFAKGYFLDKGIMNKRTAELERLSMGCTGVKRTTGQHPGGIVVVPNYKNVFDFTPYQYPADDTTAAWYTTQFDYHAMEEELLKLDILGHDDPTMLKVLGDLSGIKIEDIPLDDLDVLSLFSSPKALGVTKEEILCSTGSLGLPEFGTKFAIRMLEEANPTTFGEIVKISGLSHGTDVWANNAQDLIKNKVCAFKEVIGCRDDIMVYLMKEGLEPIDAFKIMEFVRKGKPSKDLEGWKIWEAKMKEKNIVSWYIESCRKIKYMFPKAHATAYCIMCCRVAWFKVHQPINYYAAYFSVRCYDFDIESMIKGYSSIKQRVIELEEKGFDKTNKEDNTLSVLYSALEMTARGFKFTNIDLYKSHYKNFVIADDGKTLIPPFRSLEGLGEVVAKSIYEEAKKSPFISVEDFNNRCKVSITLISKIRSMGVFGDLPETSQLSLF